MKGQVKSKKNLNRKNNNRVLQKYMLSVDEFIQSKGVSGEVESDRVFKLIKKKSRKELRREKRKMKKAKMKLHCEGKTNLSLPADTSHPQTQRKKPKEKTEKSKKDVSKPHQTITTSNTKKTPEHSVAQPTSNKGKKTSKLQESRKMALLEANEAEDREIKKLERCLGYNKRKNKNNLPQSFADDGLDYILGLLDPGSSAAALYDSDNDMDTAKDNFEKLCKSDSESGEEDEQGDYSANDTDEEGDSADEESVIDDDDEMAEDENEVIEEDESAQEQTEDLSNDHQEEEISALQVKTIESKSFSSTGVKYVPPHLRDTGDDKRKAELEKLKRTVKGLMNRLSEPNMSSISGQLEELYMSSSRKDMNYTITEVLLASCVTPALMPDRLLMEHVLLVSVLHHTVGLEVGAHFLETVVRKFDKTYRSAGEGKECVNLVAIVAHLYNFHVVHALLIFDILKLLVAGFTERDLELALFVLKNVGFSLRKDDPLALKELISDAQCKANQAYSKLNEQSRVHFMLETMLALKNNDMRKIPGYDPEPVEKLRKFQRTLIHHRAGGSDVKLRVSLENLLVAEQIGRWWIVGSSWSGAPMICGQESTTSKSSAPQGKFSAKVLDLARKQRMNTEVRRNIFCVLMTSEDYLDAFEKLLRMGLKDQQEREIVHVLMDCCLQEKTFNAFYAVLGDKFCAHERRFQMTFQFSLWDKFKELSNLPACAFSNLAQLVIFLFQKKSLSISILKAIQFGELDKPKVRFLRHVLTKLLQETEPQDLATIFGRISGIPKLGMLREGLKLFISHFLLKNSQPQSTAEQPAVLLERAQVATKAMEAKEGTLKM